MCCLIYLGHCLDPRTSKEVNAVNTLVVEAHILQKQTCHRKEMHGYN